MLWRDVHPLCEGFSARMAVPSSDAENQFMALIATKLESRVWFDCTDEAIEGTWICSEDEVAGSGYRKWNVLHGQPNNKAGGTSVGVDFAEMASDGLWADSVDQLFYSMCEMKPICNTSVSCRAIHSAACK